MKRFETIFLEPAQQFIDGLDQKSRKKLFFVIRCAEQSQDQSLFKKLRNDIWEFRVNYYKRQIRVLAFWDKTDSTQTMVIATNGFFKKTQRTPNAEIERAINIRFNYFNNDE